jgi:hypothetical protein
VDIGDLLSINIFEKSLYREILTLAVFLGEQKA